MKSQTKVLVVSRDNRDISNNFEKSYEKVTNIETSDCFNMTNELAELYQSGIKTETLTPSISSYKILHPIVGEKDFDSSLNIRISFGATEANKSNEINSQLLKMKKDILIDIEKLLINKYAKFKNKFLC